MLYDVMFGCAQLVQTVHCLPYSADFITGALRTIFFIVYVTKSKLFEILKNGTVATHEKKVYGN